MAAETVSGLMLSAAFTPTFAQCLIRSPKVLIPIRFSTGSRRTVQTLKGRIHNHEAWRERPPIEFKQSRHNINVQQAFAMIDGKAVGNKTIKLINMSRLISLRTCYIVFIDELKQSLIFPSVERLRLISLPLSTVGKRGVFFNDGGRLGFEKQNDKIQMRIDFRPVELARLIIGSFVLNPANVRSGR